MKKLRKIDNVITTIAINCVRLTAILVIVGLVFKAIDLNFIIGFSEKAFNLSNQMIMNGMFISIVAVVIIAIACALLDRIMCCLMKFKRRKMNGM